MNTPALMHLHGFEFGIIAGLLVPLLMALGVLACRQGPMFAGVMVWLALEASRMIAVVLGNSFDTPLVVVSTLASFTMLMLLTPAALNPQTTRLRRITFASCSINASVLALILVTALMGDTHVPSLTATAYWCLASGLLVSVFAACGLRGTHGMHRSVIWTWILGFGVAPILTALYAMPVAQITPPDGVLWMAFCSARLLYVAGVFIALGIAREWNHKPQRHGATPSSEPPRSPVLFPVIPATPAAARLAQGDDLSDQLDRALRQLSHTSDMQSQMGSLMSHELRAPLSTISAAAQSLELILLGSGELVDGRIARIRRSVGHMTDLLDAFFNPERVKSGPLTPMRQSIDLVELARMVIAAQQLEAAHQLVLDAPEAVMVWCDPSLCTVVTRNLVHNAIKYSPANQPIVVQVRRGRDGSSGELAVIDRGVGIDAADLGRIFEHHYRRTAHREVKGTGIGLYLARSLCENQGGQLTVDSTIGLGSCFTIILPSGKD